MTRPGWLAPLLALAACGGGAVVAPPSSADAPDRLVPWQLETEGAPPLVVGVTDTKEKIHCRFLHDESGQLRCMPLTSVFEPTETFADARCERRVYALTQRVDVPEGRLFSLPLPRASCDGPRLYVAGSVRWHGGPIYSGPTCAPLDFAYGGYVVDELSPPTRWATGVEVEGQRLSGRVRVQQIAVASGARFTSGLVDERWESPCEIGSRSGEVSCWPPVLDGPSLLEGADCKGKTLVSQAPACVRPIFMWSGFSRSGALHAVGQEWLGEASTSYHGCQTAPRESSEGPRRFFELGPALAESQRTLVAGVQPAFVGTGRLQLWTVTDDDGAPFSIDNDVGKVSDWVVPRYRDATTGLDCDPWWTPDGRVRCVSGVFRHPFGFAFSDPECQGPPVFFCAQGSACDGMPVASSVTDASGEHLTALNAAKEVPAYQPTADGCRRLDPATFGGLEFFVLGETLSWDMFPALTESGGTSP